MLKRLWVPLALLAIVPLAPVLQYVVGAAPLWVFVAGAAGIAVLADWVRRATEELAHSVGPALGGLLNISFGSAAELILAVFVLVDGKAEVVRAQITGSILATSLLGLGLAIVVGAVGRERQTFKRERAGMLSSMLVLVLIALLLPAVFDVAARTLHPERDLVAAEEGLSIGVSVVLLLLYGANLVYTLVTHRGVFASNAAREEGAARGEEGDDEREAAGWPLWASLAVLVGTTAVIAFEAELVSSALEATSQSLGLSPIFLGVIVLALIGTVADLFAAAVFARQDRMGLVLGICIGSAIQVALVIAPVLVLVSWAIGRPMTLVFGNPLDLFAIAGAAFTVNAIASDGETTWFEGVLLIGVYLLLALAFFFVAPAG